MQLHQFRPRAVRDHVNASHSSTVPAVIFALAAVLVSTQAISQTRLTRDVEALPQNATTAGQALAAPFSQAEIGLSAPIPTVEEADLSTPLPIPFSTLAATQAGSQSTPKARRKVCQRPQRPQRPRRSRSIVRWE